MSTTIDPNSRPVAGLVERTVRRLACLLAGHKYRVARRMNPGARKVVCDRCGCAWGMHDTTRAFVPWDDELEAFYAPGGPMGPQLPESVGLQPYPEGDVVGACVCGSWPGGKCLRCPVTPNAELTGRQRLHGAAGNGQE